LKKLTRHMLGENTPPDLDIDCSTAFCSKPLINLQALQRKDLGSDSVVWRLGAELASLAGRDRNQKINAMRRWPRPSCGLDG